MLGKIIEQATARHLFNRQIPLDLLKDVGDKNLVMINAMGKKKSQAKKPKDYSNPKWDYSFQKGLTRVGLPDLDRSGGVGNY